MPGRHENDLPLVGGAPDDFVGHCRAQTVAEEDHRPVLAYGVERCGHLVREDMDIGEEGLSPAFRTPRVLGTRRPCPVGHLLGEVLVRRNLRNAGRRGLLSRA